MSISFFQSHITKIFQLFHKCALSDAAQQDFIGEVRNIMQGDLRNLPEFVINSIRPKNIKCEYCGKCA